MIHHLKCVLESRKCVDPAGGQFSSRAIPPVRLRWLAEAAAVAALAMISSSLPATVAYDEGASGDLSNSGLAPTSLSFSVGDNLVFGTTGRDQAGLVDRDYFTFTLTPDEFLSGITVLSGTTNLGAASLSFIGLQGGNQVTVPPTSATAAGLLGWTHYGAGDIGTDILDNISVPAAGSSGFTTPLGPGSYALWVQDTATGTANYRFNFMVGQVPEPSTWAMMLLGFGAMGFRIRRSRKTSRAAVRPA